MHELGIAKDLFNLILNKAKENSLKKISKIVVAVGEASGIEEDFLRHSFTDHLLPETIAEGAELIIKKVPVRLRCKNCKKKIKVDKKMQIYCEYCGSIDTEIISGKDVYIEKIESV